jgi:hypothetical protein
MRAKLSDTRGPALADGYVRSEAAELAAKEQTVPGAETVISYEDKGSRA